MKTRIDLLNFIVKVAKQRAIKKAMTLQALAKFGLRTARAEKNPLSALQKAAAEIWKGVDGAAYVQALRKAWK